MKPLIVMRSHLFGTHAVSLPFLNRGGVLAATPDAAVALLEAAAQVSRSSGARYLELRHVERIYPSLTERRHKVAMTLALHDTVEGQWQSVDRKVRNLVRKGEKNGLRFSEGGLELVPTFYEVFARNMRDLGTPVFPQALFGQVMATFPEHSRVLCVHHGALPVAVAITHRRGPWLEVIWASTVREANALAANMFLYWRMISYAIGVGCRTFEFGRCTPGEGTFHFKRQWGAEPSPLVWEYWTGGAPPTFDIDQNAGGYGRAAAIWRRLPLELTNRLGPRIVRGIPC
jgi:FemAB-related protein (PEP-CTERM system-associated)